MAAFKPFLHSARAARSDTGRSSGRAGSAATADPARTRSADDPDAREYLRDRLLFAVLLDCGIRVGEAIGLRHADLAIANGRSMWCHARTTTGFTISG